MEQYWLKLYNVTFPYFSKVAAIRKKIEEERKMLAERKDLEEEERNKVKSDLDRHEKEVKKAL